MPMLRYLLLTGALVVFSSWGNAEQESRVGREEDVDLVIRDIANYLWSKEFQQDGAPRPFLIKGSYAASVWAKKHKPDLELPYNDIDVFVETDSSECPQKRRFISSHYVKGIISETTVQITKLCKMDATALIEQSDINAVNVGFTVTPKKQKVGVEVQMVPEIESWGWTEHFESFIKSKTLEIVYPHNGLQSSAIRLLYKAQQMKMNYKFPTDDGTVEKIHGAAVAPNYMKSYNTLDESHQAEITSRFDLVPIPEHEGWYMSVYKGKETPMFPRVLQNTYGGYGYGFSANDEDAMTSSSSVLATLVHSVAPAVAVAFMA